MNFINAVYEMPKPSVTPATHMFPLPNGTFGKGLPRILAMIIAVHVVAFVTPRLHRQHARYTHPYRPSPKDVHTNSDLRRKAGASYIYPLDRTAVRLDRTSLYSFR